MSIGYRITCNYSTNNNKILKIMNETEPAIIKFKLIISFKSLKEYNNFVTYPTSIIIINFNKLDI